ncbi:MAG: hypothetical protein E6J73_13390 [Deltaproteobacteria bacterium]|nr:MAG: hypothetical protein E6J73_13390 [Deltaproteobacteria bacterium]
MKAMVDVQRARDAQMAQSLIAAGNPDGAVLVAVAGHVRNDYGVPVYLTAKAAGKQVISIAFVEVDDQKPNRATTRWPMGDCPLIMFGSPHASTTKTLAKSSNPSSRI